MRFQLHALELVFPPVSNQEAEWLMESKEVEEELEASNLYFIGQRAEAHFSYEDDVKEKIQNEGIIYFEYTSGANVDIGSINIAELLNFYEHPEDLKVIIELGDKMIRLKTDDEDSSEIVEWFTTDKILYDKSRGKPFIHDFTQYETFLRYYLHYVGIAQKQNSFKRLVVKPHDKRLRILSNEHPFNIGSRVTDEVVLFFFRIKSLEIKQYLNEKDFDNVGENELGEYSRIIADAEKAFVKIMNTEYNEVKFSEYPFSTDGLYPTSVDRHAFFIDENIHFLTDTKVVDGKRRNPPTQMEYGDFIAISKETVELYKTEEK